MPFSPGETVGPYRIIEQLGHGGMATVYKAYHPALDRDVAIKVLHPAFKNDPQFFARFQREARIVAKLEHPNIVPVYDFNEHKGEPYLVMRYVQGHTLKAHMSHKPMPLDEVLKLMHPVCNALEYAHEQGVLHRDIKPSNIMLTDEGNVFLTDFGLARMAEMGESTLSQDMMVGTPQYISPEQAQGQKNLDGRTDIYSLGVILFEMLTGSVPYSGDTPFAIIHDHIYKPLPLPHTINSKIDNRLEKVILRALAKNPDDRFSSMAVFWAALDSAISPQLAQAPTVLHELPEGTEGKPKKKRNKKKIIIGAIALTLLLCVCLAIFSAQDQSNNPQQQAQSVSQQKQPVEIPASPPAHPAEQPDLQDHLPPLSPGDEAEQLTQAALEALKKDNPELALEKFNQAVEADPHYLPAYFHAANAALMNDEPDIAQDFLPRAIENNAARPEPFAMMGYLQTKAGDFEGARASYEEAIAMEPDYATAYAGLAKVSMMQGEMRLAEENIQRAKELNPDRPEVKIVEAQWLWVTGQKRLAIQLLREIADTPNLNPVVKDQLRQLFAETGQLPPANYT